MPDGGSGGGMLPLGGRPLGGGGGVNVPLGGKPEGEFGSWEGSASILFGFL